MPEHRTATPEEWQAARDELLKLEKEHTRRGDELARMRRELPWMKVEKDYRLETEEGPKGLADLFDGRSQLLVYHFMFGPSYEAGCPTCSSMADGLDGLIPHLHARDLTPLFVSRAPLEKLQAYKQRMGWKMPWASSAGTDFNFDFQASYTDEQVREHMGPMLDDPPPVLRQMADAAGTDVAGYVSEGPAATVFALADGDVYRTYSTGARGLEFLMGYYPILDRLPKGRDEGSSGSDHWVRRHDEYEAS
ncbi:MAG TPA: DUF899 domain-containing protein [Thermoleophilaceae bacterium]|nr:DUF899 domain-containing protein [Thermoleophilaceae bacterium]